MTKFLLRRTARLVVSLGAVLVAAFAMIHLIPGDPVRGALGPTAPAAQVSARRAELGLDKPLWQQFWHYLTGVFHGDLGTSIISREPVSQVIGDRLPHTLTLALLAVSVAVAVGVPAGMFAAARTENGRNRSAELAFTGVTGIALALPEFFTAIGLIVVFAVLTHVLPPAGMDSPASFILPVIALALGPAALLSRITRVETLRVLGTEYVRAARAKRLTSKRIYLRHVLPNALTATLTITGLLLSSLIAGSVLIENIFSWPGIGSRVVESIVNKDYPVAQAVVLVYGAIVLGVNLIVDIVLGFADPRSALREGA